MSVFQRWVKYLSAAGFAPSTVPWINMDETQISQERSIKGINNRYSAKFGGDARARAAQGHAVISSMSRLGSEARTASWS